MKERPILYNVRCAGRLANGFEKGKGKLIHISEDPNYNRALCGREPAIQWICVTHSEPVTCKKCKRLLAKEAV